MNKNDKLFHFDARPRRPSDPRMVVVIAVGLLCLLCLLLGVYFGLFIGMRVP